MKTEREESEMGTRGEGLCLILHVKPLGIGYKSAFLYLRPSGDRIQADNPCLGGFLHLQIDVFCFLFFNFGGGVLREILFKNKTY